MMRNKSKFPAIEAPQVVLIRAEVRTGILLNVNGDRFNGTGTPYMVFATLQDARDFAMREVINNQEIECVIFDPSNRQLDKIEPEWVRNPEIQEPPSGK